MAAPGSVGPVLVTGATGYVGRRLVPRLVAAGRPVRALVRDPSRARLPDGVEVVGGDVTRPDSLAAAVRDAAAVVHLAAVTADRKPPRGGYEAVNAAGVGALARAAAAAGVERFVQMGGVDTGGSRAGPYLAGRRRGEQAVRDSGVPWALLQPSIMFGGEDAAFVKAMADLVRRAPVVPVPGDGRLLLQLVWVEDVVAALQRLLEPEVELGRAYPIGGPDRLPYDRVLDAIGEAAGRRRVRKVHVPLALVRAQAQLLQILPRPPVTPAALELFEANNIAEPNELPGTFGVTPRSFLEHLRDHGLRG
jgi:NADH dehydrogenase